MRKVITYFIKYPVSVNVMLFAFLIFGAVGMLNMRSSFFPLSESKIITIQLNYPGASPAEMEEGVVLKIEDNLKGMVGVDRVTSRSVENSATITVETLDEYDVDIVLQDVKNAVDRVPSFPSGLEPPVISKQEAVTESITFTISGDNIDLKTLKKLAREVEDDLRRMDGISQIELSGFPEEEIEIAVRERDLRAYNLTFQEVAQSVARANILTTGGTVRTETEDYLIRANNRSYYGDELDFIAVKATPDGNIIRLSDVAEVRDIWNENPDRLYYNGVPAIQISIESTNSEDLISAADQVNEYILEYNVNHDGVQLSVTADRSTTLKERTQLLMENGLLGIFLVLILLSLFLRPRLALWVAIGLPVSLIGMFIFAAMFGVTINVLSLFGMIIVIGILVDDGIVIAENIYHHYEEGKNPIQAAVDGTMEVLPAIVSAILTTLIAFSTFWFIDARIGEFFGEVSTVVFITLSISLIEALIILPSHLAHSSALTPGAKVFLFNRWADKAMDWMRDKLYLPVLTFFLNHRLFAFAVPMAILIVTIGAIQGGIIRTTFFPNVASDQITITLRMAQGTNEMITDSVISIVERATWVVNDDFTERQEGNLQVVQNAIKRIGPGSSTATLRLNLLPGEDRNFAASEIAVAIEEEVGKLHGIESIEYGSATNFGGKPVAVALTGENIAELKGAKEALKQALNEYPLLKDISDNDPLGIKEVNVRLRQNAYLLGLTLNDLMSQVRAGFFGLQVQRFQRGQDEIRVWVRYDLENRGSVKNLDDMWIVTPTGDRVPLSEIAEYEIARGEIAINHLNGRRQIQVEADLKDPSQSATAILADIRENVLPPIIGRYPSVSPLYEGQNREAMKVQKSVQVVVPVILFLIYAVIAFTFRSYSQPLILLLLVPFSLIGVSWGHYVHNFSINMLSWLGIIALIGIVVNDGLVFIGKFNGYLKQGLDFKESLMSAGRSRFRPIFLTSITTMAGLGPLIFEKSRQAQFLIPMAISIAYGIAIATLITLLLLPVFLDIANSIKLNARWLFTGKKPSRESVERAIKERISETYEVH